MKAYDGMVFKGDMFGIKLTKRRENDPHICFSFMYEDDENWYEGSGKTSTFWLKDLREVLNRVERNLERTAKKTEEGYEFK